MTIYLNNSDISELVLNFQEICINNSLSIESFESHNQTLEITDPVKRIFSLLNSEQNIIRLNHNNKDQYYNITNTFHVKNITLIDIQDLFTTQLQLYANYYSDDATPETHINNLLTKNYEIAKYYNFDLITEDDYKIGAFLDNKNQLDFFNQLLKFSFKLFKISNSNIEIINPAFLLYIYDLGYPIDCIGFDFDIQQSTDKLYNDYSIKISDDIYGNDYDNENVGQSSRIRYGATTYEIDFTNDTIFTELNNTKTLSNCHILATNILNVFKNTTEILSFSLPRLVAKTIDVNDIISYKEQNFLIYKSLIYHNYTGYEACIINN